MSESSLQQPAKPGTACLGCRRRKLKCSREPEDCSNCLKSDLPCVYPAPETTGVKRKRGPYKKDRPARERHLEDLVKYLEPRASQSNNNKGAAGGGDDANGDLSSIVMETGEVAEGFRLDRGAESKTNPEELVKDALIALTGSSIAEKEPPGEDGAAMPQEPKESVALGLHPSISRIFEYWHLFVSRVDPLTKVIHSPSFAKTLVSSIDDLRRVGPATEALLFSVYYAAVSTCTAHEAHRRFGESREVLLHRYGRSVEASLADNYSLPVLESLQALVIYMIAIRREDNTTNVRALFSLGVRMSQLIGLQEDPAKKHPPFQTQMRRRLWWHLCGLESRGVEEGFARSNSIIEDCDVELPANLFDFDLHPDMEGHFQPRTGCTDMAFVLIRFETIRMGHWLWKIRKRHTSGLSDKNVGDLKSEQRRSLEESKQRFQTHYLRHLDESRPYDYLCIRFTKAMLIKSRLIIDHPFGQVPTKQMTSRDRFDLLQASVDIIGLTHATGGSKGAEPWLWYFRSWTQWHSLAIVVAELGWSTNKNFIDHAWAVLDPILTRWDKIYSLKRDEPAWDHVNALIERARQMRQKTIQSKQAAPSDDTQTTLQYATPIQSGPQLATSNSNEGTVIRQSGSHVNMDHANTVQPQAWDSDSGQFSSLPAVDIPFQTGCAPAMVGFEGDLGSFDGLDNIDFSAFDAVFGDSTWEISSPNTDWSMESLNL